MSRSKRGGRPDGLPPQTPQIRGRMAQLRSLAISDVADALTPKVLSPALAAEAAELAVSQALRVLPGLAAAITGTPIVAGPSEVGGQILGDEDASVVDPRRALLLQSVTTCGIDWAQEDGGSTQAYGLEFTGPVAGTRGAEMANVLVLVDDQGLAQVLGHILLLAERTNTFDQLWANTQSVVAEHKAGRPADHSPLSDPTQEK